jgi:arsenical pump membrane protein
VVGIAAGGRSVHPRRRPESDRPLAIACAGSEGGRDRVAAATSWIAGIVVAVASNLLNNLPTGLIAATTGQAAHVPAHVTGAILIGVDLGPNLSVTGSLATILWLIALRREGENVGASRFLKLGLVVMPPALLLSLLALTAVSP